MVEHPHSTKHSNTHDYGVLVRIIRTAKNGIPAMGEKKTLETKVTHKSLTRTDFCLRYFNLHTTEVKSLDDFDSRSRNVFVNDIKQPRLNKNQNKCFIKNKQKTRKIQHFPNFQARNRSTGSRTQTRA